MKMKKIEAIIRGLNERIERIDRKINATTRHLDASNDNVLNRADDAKAKSEELVIKLVNASTTKERNEILNEWLALQEQYDKLLTASDRIIGLQADLNVEIEVEDK